MVDHPLTALEDADPLPGAALPGDHLRRARQRPLGPTDEPRVPTRRSSPPTPWRSWTQPPPSGPSWSRCHGARSGRCCSPRATPSGSRRRCSSRRRAAAARRVTPPRRRWSSRSRRRVRRLGEVEQALLARGTTRSSSSSSSPRCFTEAALDEAARGRVGWGLETNPRRSSPPARAAAPDEEAARELCRAFDARCS